MVTFVFVSDHVSVSVNTLMQSKNDSELAKVNLIRLIMLPTRERQSQASLLHCTQATTLKGIPVLIPSKQFRDISKRPSSPFFNSKEGVYKTNFKQCSILRCISIFTLNPVAESYSHQPHKIYLKLMCDHYITVCAC